MTKRKLMSPHKVLAGPDRTVCIMCDQRPMVVVSSKLNPGSGICERCARDVVKLLNANAAGIVAFEREEKARLDNLTRPTRRTP